MQPFIRALPLTALNDALRAVINEGRPLTTLARELVVMVSWGVIPFGLSLKLFRWQ